MMRRIWIKESCSNVNRKSKFPLFRQVRRCQPRRHDASDGNQFRWVRPWWGMFRRQRRRWSSRTRGCRHGRQSQRRCLNVIWSTSGACETNHSEPCLTSDLTTWNGRWVWECHKHATRFAEVTWNPIREVFYQVKDIEMDIFVWFCFSLFLDFSSMCYTEGMVNGLRARWTLLRLASTIRF